MSKYTTEVRYICETAAGYDESKGFNDVDSIIAAAIPEVFSFSFPIFDESYREVLCTKILRHYYTREIGLETVGLWKLKLQTTLNEIMPFYNQLYNSELLKFNPLYDVDLTTTHVGNKDGTTSRNETRINQDTSTTTHDQTGSVTNTGETVDAENRAGSNSNDSTTNTTDSTNKNSSVVNTDNDDNTHYDLYSDTPQGALNGVDDEEYLTNARKITDAKEKTTKGSNTEIGSSNGTAETESSGSFDETANKTSITKNTTEDTRSGSDSTTNAGNMTGNANEKFNNTESYVLHVLGKQAGSSFSKMLIDFRDTFLNIDMDVINALSDLFMNLW